MAIQEIHVIGVAKRGRQIIGYRLLFISTEGTEFRDVETVKVRYLLHQHPKMFKNIEFDNKGNIKGKGGQLDRYGVINKQRQVTILKEITNSKGETIGYYCADTLGKVQKVQKHLMPRIADKLPLQNGKVVERQPGNFYVQAIEGEYEKIVQQVDPPIKHNQPAPAPAPMEKVAPAPVEKVAPAPAPAPAEKVAPAPAQMEKVAPAPVEKPQRAPKLISMDDVDKVDILKLIRYLKQFKQYPTQSLPAFVKQIENSGKASSIQRKIICKKYNEWVQAGFKPEEKVDDVPTEPKQTPQPVEKVDQTKQVEKQAPQPTQKTVEPVEPVEPKQTPQMPVESKQIEKPAPQYAPVQKSAKQIPIPPRVNYEVSNVDLLKFVIRQNGQVYVAGLVNKNTSAELLNNVVIPDTIVHNGKVLPVVGIENQAFVVQNIVRITVGKNIVDIGQRAFAECGKLKLVDLQKQRIKFIPAYMCSGDIALEEVYLPDGIERIHEKAFEDCRKLVTVYIPESCKTIARQAFAQCKALKSVRNSLEFIQDGAFLDCESLNDFDFDCIQDIGSAAFKNTGFTSVVIPQQVRTIGRRAFQNCRFLTSVEIQEGTTKIGEYAFYKPTLNDYSRQIKLKRYAHEAVRLDQVLCQKQVIEIEAGAFGNVKVIKCYVGQATEQFCKSYTLDYELLDGVRRDNQQTARFKNKILNKNPIESLLRTMETPVEGAQNPDFSLNAPRLLNGIVFQDKELEYYKISIPGEEVEPNIKFKAAVQYLHDIESIQLVPLASKCKFYQQACNIISEALYNDGYNQIYKITIQVVDDLTEGKFIVALKGREILYAVDCNTLTDIKIGKGTRTDYNVPMKQYLHTGDKLGEYQTISGEKGQGYFENFGYRKVGEIVLNAIYDYGIRIDMTSKDYYVYVPHNGMVFNIHDDRKYRTDQYGRKQQVGDISEKNVVITDIIDYNGLLEKLRNYNKNKGGYVDFFQNINQLEMETIQDKIDSVRTVGVEKEAYLFRIGKAFADRVDTAMMWQGVSAPDYNSLMRMTEARLTPELMTQGMLEALEQSYWMVPKPIQWLKQVGKKQLNKTAEYKIGSLNVTEYKSNMIVKFSNPYMNGVKHAYVFEIRQGTSIKAVMASRYSLLDITTKLYKMTKFDPQIPVVNLMQDPNNIDEANAKLFYNFYPVLSQKNGWDAQKYLVYGRAYGRYYYQDFYIAMYKPTGVFYLVQYSWKANNSDKDDKERERTKMQTLVAKPLFPIGNMDRALIVAATTNINAKNIKVLDELMGVQLAQQSLRDAYGRTIRLTQEAQQSYVNYLKARTLLSLGERDVQKYRELIDDRAIYMMGVVHQGELEREDKVYYSDPDAEQEPKRRKAKQEVPVDDIMDFDDDDDEEEIEVIDAPDEDDTDEEDNEEYELSESGETDAERKERERLLQYIDMIDLDDEDDDDDDDDGYFDAPDEDDEDDEEDEG